MAQKKAIGIELGSKEINEGKKVLAKLVELDKILSKAMDEWKKTSSSAQKLYGILVNDSKILKSIGGDKVMAAADELDQLAKEIQSIKDKKFN